MDYVILIGVIAVLALATFVGYKKGMVKLILSMVALLAACIVAAALTVPVSAALKATPIYDAIEGSVEDLVEDSQVKDNSIEKLNLPEQIKEKLMDGSSNITKKFNDYLVDTISNLILRALTFLILIIIAYIIIRIVINMLDVLANLPLIGTVNKIGGAIVGFVQGLLIIWVACLVVTAFGDKAWAQETFSQINSNALLTFIYEKNPLIFLLTKFM